MLTIDSLMPKPNSCGTAFDGYRLRPQGLRSLLNLRAARSALGAVANVCVLRTAREGEFDAEDIAAFSRLAPHLRRAVVVHARLTEAEGDRRALAETLERLPQVAFIVDGAATVHLANAAAAALLAARDGLRADPGEGGALRAMQPGETTPLRRLIAMAVLGQGTGSPASGHVCLSRPSGKPPPWSPPSR